MNSFRCEETPVLPFLYGLKKNREQKSQKANFKVCQFYDYAPRVFHTIRKQYGISNDDYVRSIGPESMITSLVRTELNTLEELISSGKSGSFFYYTADGKYTLKTIKREEFRFLRTLLPRYYEHLMKNPRTLITK